MTNSQEFTSGKAAKQFLVIDSEEFMVCSINVNLHGSPSLEVIGKLSLNNSHSNTAQINIKRVFHCDGLLVCTIKDDDTKIVVWNPCTGQTKWIQPTNRCKEKEWFSTYSLGSYQDTKSLNTSYKVLTCICCDSVVEFEICEINSNWRKIDPPDYKLLHYQSVSLKGKTYWFGSPDDYKGHIFLVSFDYTRERFERLSLDPCQIPNDLCENVALSVVREEKLSVLLQRPPTMKNEIWVTNKIDETKALSWIKIFTVDYPESIPSSLLSCYLVDEEKKAVLIMCCLKCNGPGYRDISKWIYVVRENNRVLTEVDFGAPGSRPHLYNYVPSLIQIH